MVEFKLVVSDPSDGTSKTVTVSDPHSQALVGLKIGDTLNGDPFGLPGVELKILGGTDRSGIPMRSDVPGGSKRKLLLSSPPGFKPREDGERKRKLVRGN
ncbi:MAG: 30S ribosomal protein S6e, partial [Candidatus Methanosuratincola sp.]|nr:30S ribosomal protein S6e [Candidatus Methanosuratincola sp.]